MLFQINQRKVFSLLLYALLSLVKSEEGSLFATLLLVNLSKRKAFPAFLQIEDFVLPTPPPRVGGLGGGGGGLVLGWVKDCFLGL